MTTDYSALTNAELLAAWDTETGNAKWLAQREMAKRLREYPLGSDPFRLIVALEAARAEAQRLREQRDELLKALDYVLYRVGWFGPATKSGWRDLWLSPAVFAHIDELRVSIAAEDASAQGGE